MKSKLQYIFLGYKINLISEKEIENWADNQLLKGNNEDYLIDFCLFSSLSLEKKTKIEIDLFIDYSIQEFNSFEFKVCLFLLNVLYNNKNSWPDAQKTLVYLYFIKKEMYSLTSNDIEIFVSSLYDDFDLRRNSESGILNMPKDLIDYLEKKTCNFFVRITTDSFIDFVNR